MNKPLDRAGEVEMDAEAGAARVLIASSHDGKYTYWRDDSDRYIYQHNEFTRDWVGWLCSLSTWESTMRFAPWITLSALPSTVNHTPAGSDKL